MLWAAGVAASPLGATLGVPLDRAGRVLVQPDLTIPGHPDVFVIGDLASLAGPTAGRCPASRRSRCRWGRTRPRNILRAVEGQPLRPFHYRNLGDMATIGRASAVADLPWIQLKGLVGWLAWLFVHIFNLIGFRNRLVVMVQWAWSYFSYQRAIRLITGAATTPAIERDVVRAWGCGIRVAARRGARAAAGARSSSAGTRAGCFRPAARS